jgi:hypothetical protein
MHGKIHDFITKHIVADVPDAFAACLDCGFVQCLNATWETCPNRLAHAAALHAMHAGDLAKPEEAAAREATPADDSVPTAQPA